jgi:hypothetical protein
MPLPILLGRRAAESSLVLGLEIQRDNSIRDFVSKHVKTILDKLYKQLQEEETELRNESCKEKRDYFKVWMRSLYPDHLVGPLGERPLHVCALTAARYRLGGDAEGYGVQISEGIVQGIQSFHESEPLGRQNESELRVAYGKDYVAAAVSLIDTKNESMGFPFMDDLKDWWRAKHHPDCLGMNSVKSESERSVDTLGLFEGETLFFPFIASGDEEAVRWLIDIDVRETEDQKW